MVMVDLLLSEAVGCWETSPHAFKAAMSRFMILLRRQVGTAAVCLLLGWTQGCSRTPVITVRNESGCTLSNVVISGTGFSERLADLPHGAEIHRRVRPRGESGVRLAFEAGGRQVDSGAQGYFESGGGSRIGVTVGTNLNVSITQSERGY
jgi:hypothetical protein